MKKYYKTVPVALAALFATSVLAVQKDITVIADIDPTVELLQADGTALPQTMRLNYLPGQGLQNQILSTRIYSNSATSDIEISLMSPPQLISVNQPTAAPIPLSVNYNGTDLSTAKTTLKSTTLFPAGDITNGSAPMMLDIGQKTPGPVAAAGSYQGVVSLLLNTATTAQ